MRSASSLSRRCALLIVIVSPTLLGSYFKCVAVSNPSVTTASIVELEPTTLRVGEIVQARGSGDGTPPLQFGWDFGDGTLAAGTQAAHVYEEPGSYRVTFTVRDALGNRAIDSSQVVVLSRIPVRSIVAADAIAGQPVLFDATAFEANDAALTYLWTFSDGQIMTGARAAAIFPIPGTYLARVVVADDSGAVAVEHTIFEVVTPPQGDAVHPITR